MNEKEYKALLSDTRKKLYDAGLYPTLRGAQSRWSKKFLKDQLRWMLDEFGATDLTSLYVICLHMEKNKAPKVPKRDVDQDRPGVDTRGMIDPD